MLQKVMCFYVLFTLACISGFEALEPSTDTLGFYQLGLYVQAGSGGTLSKQGEFQKDSELLF